MTIEITYTEGGPLHKIQAQDTEIVQILVTGKWKSKKLAAIMLGNRIVYDFVLRALGYRAIRYRDCVSLNISVKRNTECGGDPAFKATVKEMPDIAEYADTPQEAYELAVDTIETYKDYLTEDN